jgi:hypothetical protein
MPYMYVFISDYYSISYNQSYESWKWTPITNNINNIINNIDGTYEV